MKTFKFYKSGFVNTVIRIFIAWVLIYNTCLALDQKDLNVISLKNNKYLKIEACADKIFRIRVSSKPDFPQTLMERYGILKTDWERVKMSSKNEKGVQIFQTNGFQIVFNEKKNDISIADSKGKTIINSVLIHPEGNQIVAENLEDSFDGYFGNEEKETGIIGDPNYSHKISGNPKGSPSSSLLEISLSANERFYGGGNTSRKNIQHRGTALRMLATYQKTEFPMPFIMSSNGWGIFNNTTSLNYFDIGRFQNDKLFVYNQGGGGDMDFYLMMGNSMEEVINQYTTITGKPYLLPKWAYGLAFGGNTMENQFDVMNDAVRFRDEKIPCEIFWLEPQWMAKNYDFSTTKNWNLDKFPAEPFWEVSNFKKYESRTLFISKLHNLGFKLALWLCIDHDLSIEEEDHLAQKAGKPLSGKEHWFPHLTRFIDQGIDGFKLDPGRTLDQHPDREYFNEKTDAEMHNLNQVLLPKQMYNTFKDHKGIRSFHHYCGGYAGTQHWGASTGGDNGGGKDALFDQLNLGLSGALNTSADVLEGIDDNKAGIHLGFFLPWVQVNSWYSLHHPWYMKPEEKETFRYYAQLRNSLAPYIYSAAIQGSQTGMPILRALPLVFPDDRKVDNMIYQYMFGENLLVGVFSDSIYLPKGSWINYWTGEKYTGEKTIRCKVPETRGGLLFIKSGAIIPYQKPSQYITENPVDTIILKVYPNKSGSYTLYEDDGRSFDFEKGNIAQTLFNCIEGNNKIEFIINPTLGKYKGILSSRTYIIEIYTEKVPSSVFLDGNKIKNWSYDSAGKLTIALAKRDINEKQILTIL